ncbi:MAG: cobalamin-dependent protein [Ilumatobacteraceae bacterium]|nr:cobalamin-dependent protein [Ilumatobacteraceae bacterium]MBL6760457.1 cobalamin-dependent protein [Ilumatobacteraceae bacterium]
MVRDEGLTLHEAAAELGVHYMTAYRYVRLGQLDAAKRSGTWRVSRTEVDRFRAEPAEEPAERAPRGRVDWGQRMQSRLVAGDAGGAWSVIESALAAGSTPARVYTEVISPALVNIGERWAAGELDISVEHRATGIVQRIIGRLGPQFVRRGRSRGSVVIGAPSGERHGLVVSMLSDMVRAAGWEVSDIGADSPASSFVSAARETRSAAVVVSVTLADSLESCRDTVLAIREAEPDMPVIVGGRGIASRAVAASVGADHHSAGLDDLLDLLDQVAAGSRTA